MFHFSPRPNRAAEIHWREWSPDAFTEAAAEDKLVLFSLSAVWCHWCHVMDETTYSNAAVIAEINANFIPVRVDADMRPDINARYNMGGWPSTAVLTAQGEVLSGATYVPPGSFLPLLDRVRTFYATEREHIVKHLQNAKAARTAKALGGEAAPVLDPGIVATVIATMTEHFDDEHGGFGSAPKFPQTQALSFLLTLRRLASVEELRAERKEIRPGISADVGVFRDAGTRYEAMLRNTFSGMLNGGLYDRIEGGFYRYATQADWSVPHYEKMLEDQAGLLAVIAGFYRLHADPDLRAVLTGTCRYLERTLRDAQTGLFYGSQDADEAYSILDAEGRREHGAPYVDTRCYTATNAACIAALFETADVLGDADIRRHAYTALESLHAVMTDARGLMRHACLDAKAIDQTERYLSDQTAYLRVLVDAYEWSGKATYLERARKLADVMWETFSHEGRLRDHDAGTAVGALAEYEFPLTENAQAAETYLRLAVCCDEPSYRARAEELLRSLAPFAASQGLFAAGYAQTVSRALHETRSITIHASNEWYAMRKAARQLPDPYLIYKTEQTQVDSAFAVCCRGTVCAAPVGEPSSLLAAWKELMLTGE